MKEAYAKYETLDIEDQDHDDLSSTEAGGSIIGEDKNWNAETFHQPKRKSKRSRCCSILGFLKKGIDTLLLVTILGLLVRDKWPSYSSSSQNDVGGDITGVGPHCKFTNRYTIQSFFRILTRNSLNPDHHVQDQPDLRTIQYLRVLQAGGA